MDDKGPMTVGKLMKLLNGYPLDSEVDFTISDVGDFEMHIIRSMRTEIINLMEDFY